MKKFNFLKKALVFLVPLLITVAVKSQNAPIGCNGQYYVSHGPLSGSDGATLVKKLSFSGLTITPTVFALNNNNVGTGTGTYGFNAMGLNPVDGYIYGVRYPATSGNLEGHLVKIGIGGINQIDLGPISALNNGEIAYSACFDAVGTFYFTTADGRFFKIVNPVTSLTATLIAGSGFSAIADIAINPADGVMYAISTATSNYLFTVNTTTGALSSGVGPSLASGFFAALFFEETGNLFGYTSTGPFYLINKTTGARTAAGTGDSYSGADGCSCSFGRVFHDLDFTQNPNNQICPTAINPSPAFPLVVSVTNQTSGLQTGLTYTLNMVDPMKRFKFTESAATIKSNLIAAGVATAGSTVTLTAEAPATGSNFNKVVVTGFQTGAPASTLNFTFQVQLMSLGGPYDPVPLQSIISGLSANLGSTDLSNDPTSVTPDDPTVISFCLNTLPVKLISFSGSYKNNNTLLNWVSENQLNFAYYEIERSNNGIDFSSLTIRSSQGTGNERQYYQYSDNLMLASGSVFFYRLKMVDIDGSYKYSNVIMIRKTDKPVDGITISPNPVLSSDNVTARISASASGKVDFSIIDMSGRVVLRQQNRLNEGLNSIAIGNLDKLQAGMYLLQMSNGSEFSTVKFVINPSR